MKAPALILVLLYSVFSSANPTRIEGVGFPHTPFTEYKGKLYFQSTTTPLNNELFSFDGKKSELVADILPGPEGSFPDNFTVYKGDLYFTAKGIKGKDILKFDGAKITKVVEGYGVAWLHAMPDYIVFTGWSDLPGVKYCLYHFDGEKVVRHEEARFPVNYVSHKGEVYFSASIYGHGRQVAAFDGKSLRTISHLSQDIDISAPNSLISVGEDFYFVFGENLYRLNEERVQHIEIPNYKFGLSQPVVYRNKLYITAHYKDENTIALPRESHLLEIDGDKLLRKIGSVADRGAEFYVFDDALFYAGRDKEGSQLWKFDGSETKRIQTLPHDGDPDSFVRFQGALFFTTFGGDLWRWVQQH